MKKTDFIKKELKKGNIDSYNYGDLTLEIYNSLDPIDDRVILVRSAKNLVLIEGPLFKENETELEEYINSLNVENIYILLSNHVVTTSFEPSLKFYTTSKTKEALLSGGPKNLFNGFVSAFKDQINPNVREDYSLIKEGINEFGDIKLNIIQDNDAFNVEILGCNSIYTHMLGHDVHSIIPGKEAAKTIISELESYLVKKYDLVLTSHYEAEDLEDVKTKIAYINKVVEISESSSNREEFVTKVKEEFPNYAGLNYLDITASIFFN